jgi:hypothetical protein
VPGTDTILARSGRDWAMLFRVVSGLTHRVSVKWPSIAVGMPLLVHCRKLATRVGEPCVSSLSSKSTHSIVTLMHVCKLCPCLHRS